MLRSGLNLLTFALFAGCLCSGELACLGEQFQSGEQLRASEPVENELPPNPAPPAKTKPQIRKPGAGKPSTPKPSVQKPGAEKPTDQAAGAAKSAPGKSVTSKSTDSKSTKPGSASDSANRDSATGQTSGDSVADAKRVTGTAVTFSPTVVPVVAAGPRFRVWFANGDRLTIHQPAFDSAAMTGVSHLLHANAATPVRIPLARVARIDQLGERVLKWNPEPQPVSATLKWDFAPDDRDVRVSFRAQSPQQLQIVLRLTGDKKPVTVQPLREQPANVQTATTGTVLTVLIDPQRIAVVQGTTVLVRHPITGDRVVSLALEPTAAATGMPPGTERQPGTERPSSDRPSPSDKRPLDRPSPEKPSPTSSVIPAQSIIADLLIVAVSPESTNPISPGLLFSGTRGAPSLNGNQRAAVREAARNPAMSAALQLRSGDTLNGDPVGFTADGVTWHVAATSAPVTIPWPQILAVQLQPIEQRGDPVLEARVGVPLRKFLTSNVSLNDPASRVPLTQLLSEHRTAGWQVSWRRLLGQFDPASDRLTLVNVSLADPPATAAATPPATAAKPETGNVTWLISGEHAILGPLLVRCEEIESMEQRSSPAETR